MAAIDNKNNIAPQQGGITQQPSPSSSSLQAFLPTTTQQASTAYSAKADSAQSQPRTGYAPASNNGSDQNNKNAPATSSFAQSVVPNRPGQVSDTAPKTQNNGKFASAGNSGSASVQNTVTNNAVTNKNNQDGSKDQGNGGNKEASATKSSGSAQVGAQRDLTKLSAENQSRNNSSRFATSRQALNEIGKNNMHARDLLALNKLYSKSALFLIAAKNYGFAAAVQNAKFAQYRNPDNGFITLPSRSTSTHAYIRPSHNVA